MTETTPTTRDCKYSPCSEYRFFLYDPNDELTFWRTEEERDNAAREAIDCYLDENGWHEDVTGISAGMVTHRIVEINVKNRVGKLDEDGYDEAGEYWDSDEFESKCNYALQPFTPPRNPPMTDPTPTTPTTPTPPEGLTDKQLRDVLWKSLCERKANESPFGAGSSPESDMQARIDDCRAAIAAHEAARAQLPPNYIDDGHTGEDRELLEAFYVASRAEGGTADEIVLRGIRAAIAADRAARPAPTPEEIEASFRQWWAESYPRSPVGNPTVRSHVEFALHLLRGVQ